MLPLDPPQPSAFAVVMLRNCCEKGNEELALGRCPAELLCSLWAGMSLRWEPHAQLVESVNPAYVQGCVRACGRPGRWVGVCACLHVPDIREAAATERQVAAGLLQNRNQLAMIPCHQDCAAAVRPCGCEHGGSNATFVARIHKSCKGLIFRCLEMRSLEIICPYHSQAYQTA